MIFMRRLYKVSRRIISWKRVMKRQVLHHCDIERV